MTERITAERVRELLAVDGTRRMFGGVLMDAALVRDVAADLLDAHAALATERERADSAESAHAECQATWRAEADAHRTRADAAEAECARLRAKCDYLRGWRETADGLMVSVERIATERDAARAEADALRAIARRYLGARAAELRAKAEWVAASETERNGEDFAGPLTTAYDDASDERLVALKLLAQAVPRG